MKTWLLRFFQYYFDPSFPFILLNLQMDSLLKIGLNYHSFTQITTPLIGFFLFTTVLLSFFVLTIYHAKKSNKQSTYQAENPQEPCQKSSSPNAFTANLKSFLLMLLLLSVFIECEIQSFPDKRTTTEGIKLCLLLLSFSHHLQSPPFKHTLGFIMVIYANFRLTPIDVWLQNLCFLGGSLVLGVCFSLPYKKVQNTQNPIKLSTKNHAKTILFQSQKSFDFPSVPSFIVNKLWKKSTVSLVLLDAHLRTVYKTPLFEKLFKNRPILEMKLKSLKFKLLEQEKSPKTPNFSNNSQKERTLRDFLLNLISNSEEENYHLNLYAKLEECPPAISNYVHVYRYYDKKSMFFAIIMESSRDDLSNMVQNQSRILSFVSHEFRTPLNCITGMLQCLEDNVPQAVYEQFIQPALSSSKYLMNMLQDILDMTQIKAGKFRLNNLEFDLTLFLRDIFSLFQVQSKTKKIQLSFQIDPSVPKFISTDPNRLKQVVINLVSNAFKYTQKGEITLYGELVNNNPNILRVSVEDTGLGIKECDKPRLLKAFGKIEDEKNHEMNPQGVGLGLIISQDISKLLAEGLTDIPESEKGLKFESQYEKGSVFSFIFENLNRKPSQPHESDAAEIGFDSIVDDGPEWNVEFLKSTDKSCRFFQRSGSGTRGPGYQIVFNKQFTRKGGNTKKMTQIVCQMSFADVQEGTYTKNQITKSFPNSDNNIVFKSNVMDGLRSLGENKPVHISEKSSLLHELSISFSFSSNSNKTPSDISKLQEIVSKVENFHKKCLCPDVLVVDDDSYNILALQFLLESLNVSFEIANSGFEAVERVISMEAEGTCCKQFRLILLDIEMPGKNGLDTCRDIRKYFNDMEINDDTHIAACSGYNDKEMDERIKDAGFNFKLVKPIMKGTLIGLLAEVMSQLNFDSPLIKVN